MRYNASCSRENNQGDIKIVASNDIHTDGPRATARARG